MFPAPCQSMFRPACFTLEDMPAGSVDVTIHSVQAIEPLGVKRVYRDSGGYATVNVAPYARRLWKPAPLVGLGAGIHAAAGRHVACWITGGGVASRTVSLTGGSCDAQQNRLLSAAPATVTIAPGERDEMSVASGDWVSPVVTFRHGGATYNDTSMGQRSAEGMVTAVVDADAVARRFAAMTGAPAADLAEFTVRLRLEQAGYTNRVIERRYVVDRTVRPSRRLAWVNRYGAIDYHTFPLAAGFRSQGSRTRIETPAGGRTVATAAVQSLRLLSEPCGEADAEWLSEIFSSPAVWMVDGASFSEVEVAAGEVVCSPLQPTLVEVVVSPVEGAFSRGL